MIKEELYNKRDRIITELGITAVISLFLLIIYSDILLENMGINHILMLIGLGIVVNSLQKQVIKFYQNITNKNYLMMIPINLVITVFVVIIVDILHFFNVMLFVNRIPVIYKGFLFLLLFIPVSIILKLVIKIYHEKKMEISIMEYSYLFGVLSFYIYEYWFNLIVKNSIMYGAWNYLIYRISVIGGLIIFWIVFMFIFKKIIVKINFEKIILVMGTLAVVAILGFIILMRMLILLNKIEKLF